MLCVINTSTTLLCVDLNNPSRSFLYEQEL
jgi:hypothetical protein